MTAIVYAVKSRGVSVQRFLAPKQVKRNVRALGSDVTGNRRCFHSVNAERPGHGLPLSRTIPRNVHERV
jgi:hypothetical protein